MNNYMVAHLWANEKKESARGSNFFFEGEYFAYTKDHFMKVIQDNRITYNNVIQRG